MLVKTDAIKRRETCTEDLINGSGSKDGSLLAESDKLRQQGNHFYSLGLYSQASMIYSEAIDLQPENAVLYCSRSMAYLKQEMPSEALADAEKSLAIDSSAENIKAYWRKAQALFDLQFLEGSEATAQAGMELQAGSSHLTRVRRKAREATALSAWLGVSGLGRSRMVLRGDSALPRMAK